MAFPSGHQRISSHEQQEYELTNNKEQKAGVQVTSTEKSSNGDTEITWRPGVKSQFPWLGVGALITMIICGVLTIVILVTSNEKAAQEWPVYQKYTWIKDSWRKKAELTPSTALALVNTVTNLALAVAIGNGVAIAWWRKALKGATVQELHKSWAYSTSTVELASAGRSFNLIALCALAAKLALIDNVLLQRAASSYAGIRSSTITNIRLPIVKELPADFAGKWTADGNTGYLSNGFSQNLYNYFSTSQHIDFGELWDTSRLDRAFNSNCDGTCRFHVPGFGVNVTCEDQPSSSYPITAQIVSQANDNTNVTGEEFLKNIATSTLLSTFFVPRDAGDGFSEPWIQYTVEYVQTNNNETDAEGLPITNPQTCQGELKQRICSIRPATVSYYLELSNVTTDAQGEQTYSGASGIALLEAFPKNLKYTAVRPEMGLGVLVNGQIEYTKVLSPAYQTNSSSYENVMRSLYSVLATSFQTSVDLKYADELGFISQSSMGFVGQWWARAQSYNELPQSCIITVADPTAWLVSQVNSILLRASISAAIDQDWRSDGYQTVLPGSIAENLAADRYIDTIIFKSDYSFMGAALGVMFVCIMCVLPTYWGYWELGRKVTLGPMEIASAFQAPALVSPVVAAGGEVDQLIKEVGQREVRYGIVGDGKLGMAKADETTKLKPGVTIRSAGDL